MNFASVTGLLLLLLVGMSTVSAMGAVAPPDGKELDPPTANRPWLHEASGLRFPDELAGLQCTGRFEFNDPVLGSMLRYVEEKLRIKADLYVYPCALPHGTPEELKEAAVNEARNVLGGIRQAEQAGHYSKVTEPEVSYEEISLYPGDSKKTCLLSIPLQMTIHQDNGTGKVEDRVHSFTAIFVYEKHYVKIRCSFAADADDAKRVKAVEGFVGAVQRCVQDPGMRAEIKQHIRDYQAAPLSAKARDVAGGVSAYAEVTPLIGFSVPGGIVAIGESLDKEFTDATLDLMRGYIVGAVAEALQEPPPQELNLEQGGAMQMVKVYALMKEQKPGLKSALGEDFVKAIEAGHGPEWFEAARKKKEIEKGK